MPRSRKPGTTAAEIRPGQASYVLDRLIKDKRITPYDIQRYVADMGKEIDELQRRLDSLRTAHAPQGVRRELPPPPPPTPRKRRRRRAPLRAGSVVPPASLPERPTPPEPRKEKQPPSKKPAMGVSAETLASRQLQGRYLALIRQIPAQKRAQYAKTAKEKGREAAIKEMRNARRK